MNAESDVSPNSKKTCELQVVHSFKDEGNRKIEAMTVLAMSSDGAWLCAGYKSGWISVWKVKAGKRVTSRQIYKYAVRAIGFRDDNKAIVAADDQGDIFETKRNGSEPPVQLLSGSSSARPVAISQDHHQIAMLSSDTKPHLVFCDILRAKISHTPFTVPRCDMLAIDNKATRVVLLNDGKISVYDIANSKKLWAEMINPEYGVIDGQIETSLAMSPKGESCAVAIGNPGDVAPYAIVGIISLSSKQLLKKSCSQLLRSILCFHPTANKLQ